MFSKNQIEIDALKQEFGGNDYKHLNGRIWVQGNTKDHPRIAEAVRPHLKEKHGLGLLFSDSDNGSEVG